MNPSALASIAAPERADSKREPKADNVRVLVREWRRLAGILSLFLMMGLVLAFVIPPVYESSAAVMPSDAPTVGGATMTQNSLAGMAAIASGAVDLGLHTPGAKFIVILHSKTLADRLVDRFNLMQVYRAKLRSLARETLANNTIILEDRRTGLITITVRDHDKQRARDLAQAYTEELNRLNAEMNAGAAHQQRVFLEQRLEEVKTQLDKTSNELANFSSRSAVFAPDQLKAQAESAAKLEGTLMGLQTTLSGLLERYTEKNLRVQEVEAQIASVQEQLRKLRGNQPSGGSGGGSEPLFPNLSSLSHLQPAYTGLLRDSKGLTAVYEILEQQLELAKIEEVKELPTIRVLDTPELADFRVSPHRRAILMVAGFFGLLVGAGYVLLRNYSAQGGFGSVIGFLRFRILDILGLSEGFTPKA
jgi:uncharacterized protein involved in exopolysaccharide biosynthesis